MIVGVVTTRHILLHAPAIAWLFGTATLLRCLVAMVDRQRHTFLSLVTR